MSGTLGPLTHLETKATLNTALESSIPSSPLLGNGGLLPGVGTANNRDGRIGSRPARARHRSRCYSRTGRVVLVGSTQPHRRRTCRGWTTSKVRGPTVPGPEIARPCAGGGRCACDEWPTRPTRLMRAVSWDNTGRAEGEGLGSSRSKPRVSAGAGEALAAGTTSDKSLCGGDDR
jgi:hypothetical protein